MKLEEFANRLDELVYRKGIKFEMPIKGETLKAKVVKDRGSSVDIEVNKGWGLGKEMKQINKESFVRMLKRSERGKLSAIRA